MHDAESRRFVIRDRNWHPKALTPTTRPSVPRSPSQALVSIPQSLRKPAGRTLPPQARPPRQRPAAQLRPRRPAPGRAHHHVRPGLRPVRQAGPAHPGGDVAGQRRRALPAQERPLPGAARPELRRRRPDPSPTARATITSAPSSRALSLAQRPQRLAPGAHPRVRQRPGDRRAAGHPDVLRGRPADPRARSSAPLPTRRRRRA